MLTVAILGKSSASEDRGDGKDVGEVHIELYGLISFRARSKTCAAASRGVQMNGG